MIGAYIGVPASMICVLHRLYMSISAPDSLPDKVRAKNTSIIPFLTLVFQRFYQLLSRLALMLGMPALIIVARESQLQDYRGFLELIYSNYHLDIIVQGSFL